MMDAAWALPDEVQPYRMYSVESAHFVVRYPQNTKKFADRALDYAEYAYGILSRRLDAQADKITIELVDRVDEMHSFMTTDGQSDYMLIYLWPSQDIFYAYDGKWLERQIAYHIARILIQRTKVDWIHSYNNRLLPSWYLSGLASYYETPDAPGAVSERGYAALLGRNVPEKRMISDLDELIFGKLSWLGKRNAKIYGAAFIGDLIRQYGEQRLIDWNHENASSFQNINRISRKVFGWDWQRLYRDWHDRRAGASDRAKASDRSSGRELVSPWLNELPQLMPGRHALSFVRETDSIPRAIAQLDLETLDDRMIVVCSGRCEHHWSADGETLYYLDLNQTGRYVSETLYRRELGKGYSRKVPVPGHIRTFAVTESAIYAVSLNNEMPVIYRLRLEAGAQAEPVYVGKPFGLIEELRAIDSKRLVASVYDPASGQFDLHVFEAGSEVLRSRAITDDGVTEMYPFKMRDGVIGYVTERADGYDIRAVTAEGEPLGVIHSQADGIAQPVAGENGEIYYTSVSASGFSIRSLSSDDLRAADHAPLEGWRWQADIPVAIREDAGKDWSFLVPDSYHPLFGFSDDVGRYLGIGIENRDVLGHHFYHAHFSWFFDRKMCDMALVYRWSQYLWHLEGGVGVTQRTHTIDFGDDYLYLPFQTYWAYLATGSAWHFPVLDIRFSAKFQTECSRTNEEFTNKFMSSDLPAGEYQQDIIAQKCIWANSLIAGVTLEHLRAMPNTLPGEIGYSISFETRIEGPFLGDDVYSFSNILDLKATAVMPWGMGHAAALELKYGFASSESRYFYPLEVQSSVGFGFNDMGSFHGIRAGNIISNNHLLYAHAAYTFPITNIDNSWTKLPVAFHRIGLGAIGDWALMGQADQKMELENSLFGIGAELYIDMMLEYNYPMQLIIGYEKGFGQRSGNAFYIFLTW